VFSASSTRRPWERNGTNLGAFFFFFLFALLINSACALAFPHELGAALCDTCQMLTQSNEGGSIAEASKATYIQLLLYYLRS